MNNLKLYYAVNLLMESENPLLNQIKDELIPKYGKLIPWFGVGPTNDMREVFRMDKAAVESADIIIAEVSYPSHGVGMEVMHAVNLRKPILAIAQEGKKVSRMIQGIDFEGFQFSWYKDLEDLDSILNKYFSENKSKI